MGHDVVQLAGDSDALIEHGASFVRRPLLEEFGVPFT